MALAAGGAALAVLWTPVGLLEMLIASTGLSEAVPSAAPPLGLTARLLIAGFAALMAAGLVSATGGEARTTNGADEEFGGRESTAAKGESKMGFALSKLAALARGRAGAGVGPVEATPTLRRADAHPDAPARAPIFASRDFDGVDIFNRTASRAKAEVEAPPFATPVTSLPPSPKPWETAEETGPRFAAPAFLSPDLTAPTDEPVAVTPAIEAPLIEPLIPTEKLTITQLTARLERGLAQRAASLPADVPRIIADMPVAPRVAVRDTVEADAEEALAAALGTLRQMATRVR